MFNKNDYTNKKVKYDRHYRMHAMISKKAKSRKKERSYMLLTYDFS